MTRTTSAGGPDYGLLVRDHQWTRADRIFDLALDVGAADREAFLRKACADDPTLERRILALLEFADSSTSCFETAGGMSGFLESVETLHDGMTNVDSDFDSGTVIGNWRIERELGRGGMAVVYLAERADSEAFDQQVAIKVMRPTARHSASLIERLERERQILARASHPNLATVIDGGTTSDGRPYVVLEYVHGVSIDRFCNERGLDAEARLRLFLQVADGVGYAHRSLIIHRDIKPSNIMVDEEGKVKLLDFGIAKLVESPLDLASTGEGVRPLTPAWASPEQLRAEPVTTASDIYQLGLLLYVLLTGRSPYPNPRRGSLAELLGRLTEVEPTSPSHVLADETRGLPDDIHGDDNVTSAATVAEERRTSPAALARFLKGDLDAIILKCLRVSPEHRYNSVESLVDDVKCFLDRRPVRARRDTVFYRLGKFARRHAWLLATLAILGVVTVIGAGSFVRQARVVASERNRANQEVRHAQMTLDYLVETFDVLDPEQARGAALTAPEILRRGVEKMDGRFDQEPLAKAKLLGTLGRQFLNLGLYQDAASLFEQAIELRESGEERTLELAWLFAELGRLHYRKGEFWQAESMFERALSIRQELLEPDASQLMTTRLNLANIKLSLGDRAGAEAEYRGLLETERRRLGDQDPIILGILNNLSAAVSQQGRHEEALELLEELVDLRNQAQGPDHPDALGASYNLASTYAELGRRSAAESLFGEVLEHRRRVLGNAHPETLRSKSHYAWVLFQGGDEDQGLSLLEQSRAQALENLGADDPVTLSATEMLTNALFRVGRQEEGCNLLVDLEARVRSIFGASHSSSLALSDRVSECEGPGL